MLFVPCAVNKNSTYAFSFCLVSFLIYEFIVGVYVPSEGMIRSIYMPTESMCSTMNMLRIITNVLVAIGVFSTTFVPLTFSFGVLSTMMLFASVLQLSLVPKDELMNIFRLFTQSKSSLENKDKQNWWNTHQSCLKEVYGMNVRSNELAFFLWTFSALIKWKYSTKEFWMIHTCEW